MIRLIELSILGTALASCAAYEANVGKAVDMIPEWAGGLPKGVPPRPGTPEYDVHRKGIDERGKVGAQPQDAKKSEVAQQGAPQQ
jgi:hypothetical protein